MIDVPDALLRAMNDAVIRRLAGDQSYERGLDYFSRGRVASLQETGEGLRALVRGSQNYSVRLEADDGVLDYACDCPVGADGFFANTASRSRLRG